ncbi:hypothetical protein F0562_014267 [Nyssa sinensis]|uniref:Uncharacterized protein n=1 Tax=Nyssa sinensis TaxID=561372 RepID=A0A5J4ZSG2_9ASTE|nr:hypothetical protein F0562_014267 [Nyssa sinensis]
MILRFWVLIILKKPGVCHVIFLSLHITGLIPKESGRNFQVPFSVGGISSAEARSAAVPASTGSWPPVNMQNSNPLPLLPNLLPQKQNRNQFDSMNASNTVTNQNLNQSILPEQQLDNIRNRAPSSAELTQFHNEQAGSIHLNLQNPAYVTPLQPQLSRSQELQQNLVPPASFQHLLN